MHRALFCHCYGHSLNLATSDAIKGCKVVSDALDTTFDISKLIKFSPRREGLFENIKKELAPDSPGLRVLCPTRWTVRGESLQSVINNYSVLQEVWDECLESRLQPDIRSRVIGVQAQMQKFNFIFGVILGERILKHADNLSKTLQHRDLSAAEAQAIAELRIKTLQMMRNDEAFSLFWELVKLTASKFDVGDPLLPRRRKVPQRYEVGRAEPEFSSSPEALYKTMYFEALDLVVNCIKARFHQLGYVTYKNLEELLIHAVNRKESEEKFKLVTEFLRVRLCEFCESDLGLA